MSFTEHLAQVSQPIFSKVMAHPTVQGIGDGSLPKEKFVYWLKQDYQFLEGEARTYALGAATADSITHVQRFAKTAHDCATDDLRHYRQTAKTIGIPVEELESAVPSPTTEAYSNFLVRTAGTGSTGDLVAADLACYWWYNRIARRLAEEGKPTKEVYADWIDRNASKEATEGADQFKALMDDLAAESTEADRKRYKRLFMTAARYEYMLWDAVWHEQRWPVDPPSEVEEVPEY